MSKNIYYLLELRAKNQTHTRKIFSSKMNLFGYLNNNQDRIFNHGFERNEIVINEIVEEHL